MPPAHVPFPGAHLGLRWRHMIPSDAPAVAALIREVENADDAIYRTSAADIADMVEGRRGHDHMDAIVGLDADRAIAAVGSVRILRSVTESACAMITAYIHPHWRGRGVGRSLLYWQDGRARQLLVEHFGADSELPASISNWVDGHMTDRRRLYIAAGFYAKRTFQVMYRDLEGSEQEPKSRHGYTAVSFDHLPRAQVRALHDEVFLGHFLPEMRGLWWDEAMEEIDDRWSFVALSPTGELAGYCIVGRPEQRWVATGRTEAYVSLVGVAPEHRGKSLATLLLRSSISAAARSGVSRIGLDVDMKNASGAHAIYEHLGFVDERSEVFYTIDQ